MNPFAIAGRLFTALALVLAAGFLFSNGRHQNANGSGIPLGTGRERTIVTRQIPDEVEDDEPDDGGPDDEDLLPAPFVPPSSDTQPSAPVVPPAQPVAQSPSPTAPGSPAARGRVNTRTEPAPFVTNGCEGVEQTFETNLRGTEEVPAVAGPGSAYARFTFDSSTGSFSTSSSFTVFRQTKSLPRASTGHRPA